MFHYLKIPTASILLIATVSACGGGGGGSSTSSSSSPIVNPIKVNSFINDYTSGSSVNSGLSNMTDFIQARKRLNSVPSTGTATHTGTYSAILGTEEQVYGNDPNLHSTVHGDLIVNSDFGKKRANVTVNVRSIGNENDILSSATGQLSAKNATIKNDASFLTNLEGQYSNSKYSVQVNAPTSGGYSSTAANRPIDSVILLTEGNATVTRNGKDTDLIIRGVGIAR